MTNQPCCGETISPLGNGGRDVNSRTVNLFYLTGTGRKRISAGTGMDTLAFAMMVLIGKQKVRLTCCVLTVGLVDSDRAEA